LKLAPVALFFSSRFSSPLLVQSATMEAVSLQCTQTQRMWEQVARLGDVIETDLYSSDPAESEDSEWRRSSNLRSPIKIADSRDAFNVCPLARKFVKVKNTFVTIKADDDSRRKLCRGFTGPARIESIGDCLLEGGDESQPSMSDTMVSFRADDVPLATCSLSTIESIGNSDDGSTCVGSEESEQERPQITSDQRSPMKIVVDDLVACLKVKDTFVTMQVDDDSRRKFCRKFTGPARIESCGDRLLEEADRNLWKQKQKGRRNRLMSEPAPNMSDAIATPLHSLESVLSSVTLTSERSCAMPAKVVLENITSTSDHAFGQDAKIRESGLSTLAKGESDVKYKEGGMMFEWSVNLRTAHTKDRCGFQRKFNLRIGGNDAPFVFHIDPIAKELVGTSKTGCVLGEKAWPKKRRDASTFRRPGTYAHLWIRCADPSKLPKGNTSMSISITGGVATRHISEDHDFAQYANCNQVVPESSENLWEFPFDMPESCSWSVSGQFRLVKNRESVL